LSQSLPEIQFPRQITGQNDTVSGARPKSGGFSCPEWSDRQRRRNRTHRVRVDSITDMRWETFNITERYKAHFALTRTTCSTHPYSPSAAPKGITCIDWRREFCRITDMKITPHPVRRSACGNAIRLPVTFFNPATPQKKRDPSRAPFFLL